MSRYIIEGGKAIEGEMDVKSAKNSILPILSACLLTNEKVVLHKCPKISDVSNMIKIIVSLGAVVTYENDDIIIDSSNINSGEIPKELACEMRSSIFLLGSIISRVKNAKTSYPGGCNIGLRPIDIHIKAFEKLNIIVRQDEDYLFFDGKNSKANNIYLDMPSVGATENILLASVFLEGETVIENVAREPEVVDLQNFLNKMGAKIKGAGTNKIVVNGVKTLHGVEYTPVSDRIVVGTFAIATAMCGGNLVLKNALYKDNQSLFAKLSKTYCKIDTFNDIIIVRSKGRLKSIKNINTMYYPAFPTDLQSQMMALQTISEGTSIIKENIFEDRFKTVPELKKMGANIKIKENTVIVKGVPKLKGAMVTACDLRGGASLVLAGMVAEGVTTVEDIYHIDRGYENLDKTLVKLGINIIRVD